MKKTMIVLLAAAALFTACNNKDNTASTTIPMPNPFINPMNTDGTDLSFAQRIMMESPEYTNWRKQKIEDDRVFNEQLDAKAAENKVVQQKKTAVIKPQTKATNSTASNTTDPNSNTTAAQPVKKRKGWSNAAKGTVIGAGTGAVVGVIVSKNKVKGGILGGLLGAGGGYVIGNEIDKKKKGN